MHGALLIVFVLAQDAAQQDAQAFTAAALEVLGAGALVRMVPVPADLPDASVLEHARAAAADGAIELSWTHDRLRALIHCYIAGEQRWIDRSITFGHDDQGSERGRMLGYAVASMFLTEPSLDPVGAADPRDLTPHEPAEDAKLEDSSSIGSAATSWAFDFGGLASHGLGGEADALGVTAALQFLAVDPLWVRAGVGGRTGEIPAAQATMNALQASAGAALNLFDRGRVRATVRADLIASWLSVAHLSPDDPQVARQHRWLFGSDAVATAGLRLGAGASLFVGGGIEAMFGATDIYTHGVRVATVPPLRLIAEFGLRSEF